MAGKKRPTAEKDQAKKVVADKKDNGKDTKKGDAKSKTPAKGKKAAAKPAATKKKAAPKKSNGQPKIVAHQVPEPVHEAVKLEIVAEKEEVQVIPAEPVVKAMVDAVIEAAAEVVVVDVPMMNGHHSEPEVVEDAQVVDLDPELVDEKEPA